MRLEDSSFFFPSLPTSCHGVGTGTCTGHSAHATSTDRSGITITKESRKFITQDNLFGGTTYKPVRPSRTIEEEEAAMAEAMSDALEDDRLDDGAIEIDSDNKCR